MLNGLAWLLWLGIHAAGGLVARPTIGAAPHLWHGHEMIFGYAMAVVAGFFLTAVPSWTGTVPVRGWSLGLLGGVWIVGRLAVWSSAALPPVLVAALDLAFIPLLAGFVGNALRHKPAPRNLVVLGLLAFLFAGNVMVHLLWLGGPADLATTGLAGGVLALATLIAIIGGRVVPAFTRNALEREGRATTLPRSFKPLEIAAIAPLGLLLLARLLDAPEGLLAVLAGLAALAHAVRLALWRGTATRHAPILWSLHLGYAWMPIGLAALAFAYAGGGLAESTALHALAIGAAGGMTLAVMTRAALGHSGRPLVVGGFIAWAYALVSLSAVLRVFAPTLAPAFYMTWILAAGLCWTLAFVIFLLVYWPILTGPDLGGGDENTT